LCDVEIAAGIRRALMRRALSAQRAAEALGDYLDLPLTGHGHQLLVDRILELANNFSAYDATYVALAEQMGAVVLTADRRLARAVGAYTRLAILPST
jgi:predicted nucleic acid-binding protein